MSSSSLSECIGKLTGLFGPRLDEAAGSFLGDNPGEFGFSPGFFFFPVFCFLVDCSALGELLPLAQGEAVPALHHYLLLQGTSGLLEVKVPRQSEESVEMAAAETAKRHHPQSIEPTFGRFFGLYP